MVWKLKRQRKRITRHTVKKLIEVSCMNRQDKLGYLGGNGPQATQILYQDSGSYGCGLWPRSYSNDNIIWYKGAGNRNLQFYLAMRISYMNACARLSFVRELRCRGLRFHVIHRTRLQTVYRRKSLFHHYSYATRNGKRRAQTTNHKKVAILATDGNN